MKEEENKKNHAEMAQLKLLNLTKNEMVDIDGVEETPSYALPKYELMNITKEIKYTLANNHPAHWNENDSYKVIEV